jgi:hypothetical protein
MRTAPEPVLEVTTSVPDLSAREPPYFIPGPYTPDQMQHTVPFYGEIHAFDMVLKTEAQAGELRCPGPCGWSRSGGVGDPAYVAARAERRTKQQKASDTKQTWLHTHPRFRATRFCPRFVLQGAPFRGRALPSNPGAASKKRSAPRGANHVGRLAFHCGTSVRWRLESMRRYVHTLCGCLDERDHCSRLRHID